MNALALAFEVWWAHDLSRRDAYDYTDLTTLNGFALFLGEC